MVTKLNLITVNTGPPAGEGFILSKNADFSTDDRTFATTETIHMMVFSDLINFNNMKKNEWNLSSPTGATSGSFANNLDGTFTSSIAVSALPGGATAWSWSARVEDGDGNRFQPSANITISAGPPPPVADFTATPTSGCVPVAVAFTDASTGSITSWLWDFGDGATSTLQNPSHTYTVPGVYTVGLTASNACGTSVPANKVAFITVTDPPAGPNVHVSVLTVTRQDQGGGRFVGTASVTIVDENNNPVKDVTVDVFDVRGRRVRRLADRSCDAGVHSVLLDANGLASGIYFYRVRTPEFTATRKIVLTK